jgi:hypothetical protein
MCVGSSWSPGLEENRMRSVTAVIWSIAFWVSCGDMCSRTSMHVTRS